MFPIGTPAVSSGPLNSTTDSNRLHQTLKTSTPAIVFVHASWCGHCKTMYPFWNSLCKSRRDKSRLISVESEVVKQFESAGSVPEGWRVAGFPTIWLVKGWRVVDTFHGGGSALASWANKHLGPQRQPVVTRVSNISAPRMEPLRKKIRRRSKSRKGRAKIHSRKGRGKKSRGRKAGKRTKKVRRRKLSTVRKTHKTRKAKRRVRKLN